MADIIDLAEGVAAEIGDGAEVMFAPEFDLKGIKEMAKAAGMPYQTLINSIIHRYVTGGIVFKVAV